jgi:hypothetical protein
MVIFHSYVSYQRVSNLPYKSTCSVAAEVRGFSLAGKDPLPADVVARRFIKQSGATKGSCFLLGETYGTWRVTPPSNGDIMKYHEI